MQLKKGLLGISWVILLLTSCTAEKKENSGADEKAESLFTMVSPDVTGISFINAVENQKNFNIFKYRNFYNGGGVAIGDMTVFPTFI